jgi:hypothetical protein
VIIITKLAQPEVGAVMAQYCAVCKNTTFMLHPLAEKPEDGDYWLLTMSCHRHLWPWPVKKFTCELESVKLKEIL